MFFVFLSYSLVSFLYIFFFNFYFFYFWCFVYSRRFQSNPTACIVVTQERNEVTSILHLACVHWSTWLLQLLGAELAVKQDVWAGRVN